MKKPVPFVVLLCLFCGQLPALDSAGQTAAGEMPARAGVEDSHRSQEKQDRSAGSDEEAMQEIISVAEDAQIRRLLSQHEGPLFGVLWNGDVFVDAPLNSEPDNSDLTLRRARLAMHKGMGKWNAKMTVELSSGDLQLQDNYIEYSGWKRALAKAGIFNEPFSLESMSTARGQTFMEQSLTVVALSPGRSVGAGALRRTKSGILSGGLFLRSPPEDGVGEAGQALSFRYARSPLFRQESEDVNVGISYSYRINAEAESSRFRSRPETGTTDDRYVDTDRIEGADSIQRIGIDTSRVNGPFSVQAELMSVSVGREGFEDVRFWGAYVYVSWFLTGETRNYDQAKGRFRQVNPTFPLGSGGKGSFELTARLSYVDLSDKDIIGGRQNNFTIGLNWRPTSNWRVMANLIKVIDVDRPGSEFDGLDPLIFSARLQWEY
jgi:phosphate-selective porin OprO/OprP